MCTNAEENETMNRNCKINNNKDVTLERLKRLK